jgi:capsular exopolysaccharide synthesis family protein
MIQPDQFQGVREALRELKEQLIFFKTRDGKSIFTFFAPHRRTGVSTVVFNLGLLMAQDLIDQKILIVDANRRNPALQGVFNLPTHPGLLDYLANETEIENIFYSPGVENLSVIPIGQERPYIPSPFDLKRLDDLIIIIRELYDYILFDTAPVLFYSEAKSLARKTDGAIVVARAQETKIEVLKRLRVLCEKAHIPVLGGVLNMRQLVIPQWLYQII